MSGTKTTDKNSLINSDIKETPIVVVKNKLKTIIDYVPSPLRDNLHILSCKTTHFLFHTSNYIHNQIDSATTDTKWWSCFIFLCLASVVSRLYYLDKPNQVVWDEAHFGKFGSWYINRTFFFDVHPPGGKMLIALFGYLGGYNASHTFSKPGDSYEGYQGIIYMRLGCALMGSCLVTLAFLTVWEMTSSIMAAFLAGILNLFEIGTILLTKFILLDSSLMLFMTMSFHGTFVFANQKPFGFKWWLALAYSGLSLGLVTSVKFIGIFTICTIGTYTIANLWNIYGNTAISILGVLVHFIGRAVCLIALPLLIYLGIFCIHLHVLNSAVHSTVFELVDDKGAVSMSVPFQMNLINSSLYNLTQPENVVYGNRITLRMDFVGGCYLHSHNVTYPIKKVGRKMQQITGMRGRDANNIFRVLFPSDDPDRDNMTYSGEIEEVLPGDWIRLLHVETNRTLAVSRNKSVLATKQFLVYAKPHNLTKGELPPDLFNADEMWEVRRIFNLSSTDSPIRAIRDDFQLVSPYLKCALVPSMQKLPVKWGFGQAEIGCSKNLNDPHSYWMIENNFNSDLTNVTYKDIKISLWDKVIESHKIMHFINSRLQADDESQHFFRPWHWPILYRSAPWYDIHGHRVVLLGNPLIFFFNFITILLTPLLLIGHQVSKIRSNDYAINNEDNIYTERTMFATRWLFVAYLFHYVPFYFMNRVLYYHHYFCSLQFLCMQTAVVFTFGIKRLSSRFFAKSIQTARDWAFTTLIILLTLSYCIYFQIGYGYPTNGYSFRHDNSTYRHVRLIEAWDI